MNNLDNVRIGVIGLGYVGLPLALSFGKFFDVIGFDTAKERIEQLKIGYDKNGEVSQVISQSNQRIKFTDEIDKISDCNCYIVTVETPIDTNSKPDTTSLVNVCDTLGKYLKENDYVIFESTVYPGCTENLCIPVLEKTSGLKCNLDFFCGYSPERVSPGKGSTSVEDIVKITSGSNKSAATFVTNLYSKIIKAGVFEATSIQVAEAAKITENIQRDVNIALINELAMFFGHLQINIYEVLDAAKTKWNFHDYLPGLVGGHCIGVDPYYLIERANAENKLVPLVTLARETNESTIDYLFMRCIDNLNKCKITCHSANILFLGASFKANCGDMRNSKVPELIHKLTNITANVDCYDPLATQINNNLNSINDCINKISKNTYNMVVIAVAHEHFFSPELQKVLSGHRLVYDITGKFQHLNSLLVY